MEHVLPASCFKSSDQLHYNILVALKLSKVSNRAAFYLSLWLPSAMIKRPSVNIIDSLEMSS